MNIGYTTRRDAVQHCQTAFFSGNIVLHEKIYLYLPLKQK
jgi:hypothetical protein